jgi:putative transcriptional regulator
MIIKNFIKLHRVKAGDITQAELAVIVGCSRQTINSIEKNKFKPSIELALKLALAFNVKVDDIFRLEDE